MGWTLDDLVAEVTAAPYDGRSDEEFVLGNCIVWPLSCAWELDELHPGLFRDPMQKEVAVALCRLRDAGQGIDRRRLAQRIGKTTAAGRLALRLWEETSLYAGIGDALLRLKAKRRARV
jgi:hypothetical protein